MPTLIAALLELAPVLIKPAIRAVEALFGPGSGSIKMEAVLAALKPVLEKLASNGKLPGVPDEETLRTIIEAIFQSEKGNKGIELPTLAGTVDGISRIEIPPGSIVTVQFPAAATPKAPEN